MRLLCQAVSTSLCCGYMHCSSALC
uniref:Uncharacterized protein n=1 Tax=Anguilla anguilla TaxID=7936 RepID=A0A0E9TIG0_ANGAN